jgi:AdoMet-dependent rRNA methyltransferase SPB1
MELDARPIKKVAEAKARKKFKAMKRMEKLKAKAELIAMNQEMTEDAKVKGDTLSLFLLADFSSIISS